MLTRKPRVGDRIRWPALRRDFEVVGVVTEVKDSDVVLMQLEPSGKPSSFIWRFADGAVNQVAEIVGEEG